MGFRMPDSYYDPPEPPEPRHEFEDYAECEVCEALTIHAFTSYWEGFYEVECVECGSLTEAEFEEEDAA